MENATTIDDRGPVNELPNAARGTTTATRSKLGRSGPRSRSGCVTCKRRRVRCDEKHPLCGSCARLQLECHYRREQHQRKANQGRSASLANGIVSSAQVSNRSSRAVSQQPFKGDAGAFVASLSNSRADTTGQETPQDGLTLTNSHGGTALTQQYNQAWGQPRRAAFNEWNYDFDTSWAGEFPCLFPEIESPTNAPLTGVCLSASTAPDIDQSWVAAESTRGVQERSDGIYDIRTSPASNNVSNLDRQREPDGETLIGLFRKIVQPPAAILIGGFERWRRLQQYLCKLGEQSRAVKSSLLCVIETLMLESPLQQSQDRDECMTRIAARHTLACEEIRAKLCKHPDLRPKAKEHLLAAIFLLAWYEVIRPARQDDDACHFPHELAEKILCSNSSWNRLSHELLSWLRTLDNKASHLGGESLLSAKALEIVSHYPIQITSSLEGGDHEDSRASISSNTSLPDFSPSTSAQTPFDLATASSPRSGKIKQMMLHTIVQPALEWYLTAQSYCRRISAHDKHHRSRFTSEDEYEVVVSCKGLESELLELWQDRPSIISLDAEQLSKVVSHDLATKLEEVFSVYLASFWILFVYLHRLWKRCGNTCDEHTEKKWEAGFKRSSIPHFFGRSSSSVQNVKTSRAVVG